MKYVTRKSQRSYGFSITKELTFGFQILDLNNHFSASLSEAITSTKITEDKPLYRDICSLCDMLSHQETNEGKWSTSDQQLADCFPKDTASHRTLDGES